MIHKDVALRTRRAPFWLSADDVERWKEEGIIKCKSHHHLKVICSFGKGSEIFRENSHLQGCQHWMRVQSETCDGRPLPAYKVAQVAHSRGTLRASQISDKQNIIFFIFLGVRY